MPPSINIKFENDMNEELNKLNVYINKCCVFCGRKYPKTILNIEGIIHHNEKYRCLDLKSCKRTKRKINKR